AALRIWRAERSLLRANTLSPGRRPTTVRRKITDATIDAKTREETGRFECGGTYGPCRPAQAGIQGKSGAPCAQRPGLRPRRSDEGGYPFPRTAGPPPKRGWYYKFPGAKPFNSIPAAPARA